MLRAANCQRSPRSHQPLAPVASEPVMRSGRNGVAAPPQTSISNGNGNPTPLTSTGSTASSTASSGYSSIQSGGYNHETSDAIVNNGNTNDYNTTSSANSNTSSNNSSMKVSVPSVSSGSSSTDSSSNISSNGSYRIIPIIKVGINMSLFCVCVFCLSAKNGTVQENLLITILTKSDKW